MATDNGNLRELHKTEATVDHNDIGDLSSLLAGADVGLALFNSELKLLVCNQLYRDLCGYTPADVTAGTLLPDLITKSLKRQRTPAEQIELTVARSINRLNRGEAYSFEYTSPNSRQLLIRRRRLTSGSVVETVRERVADTPDQVDLNVQFSQIANAARERMMHALDVMADGFRTVRRPGSTRCLQSPVSRSVSSYYRSHHSWTEVRNHSA